LTAIKETQTFLGTALVLGLKRASVVKALDEETLLGRGL